MARHPGHFAPPLPLSYANLSAALRADAGCGYARVGRLIAEIAAARSGVTGAMPSAEALRGLLLDCADHDRASELASISVPRELARLLRDAIAQVRARAQEAPPDFFSLDNDAYVKDLALCLGQLFPCGARLVDLNAGLGRSLLLYQGKDLPAVLRFFLRAGGFRPWFETHVDPRDLSEFNERGLVRMYVRVGALLEANPQVLGVFGGSWFYDPQLENLSPHLAYLRQLPQRYGARLLQGPPDPPPVAAALLKSQRRRDAYERGDYRPRNLFLVWPRRALLAWAHAQGLAPTAST